MLRSAGTRREPPGLTSSPSVAPSSDGNTLAVGGRVKAAAPPASTARPIERPRARASIQLRSALRYEPSPPVCTPWLACSRMAETKRVNPLTYRRIWSMPPAKKPSTVSRSMMSALPLRSLSRSRSAAAELSYTVRRTASDLSMRPRPRNVMMARDSGLKSP